MSGAGRPESDGGEPAGAAGARTGGEQRCALRLVHHHPGRLRLRSSAFLHDEARAQRAREALLGHPAVREVLADPKTGSLVIEYEPSEAPPDALGEHAARACELRYEVPVAERNGARHGSSIIDAWRRLNVLTLELTGCRLELRTVVPAALAGLSAGVLVFGSGPRAPRWDNLAYWAFSMFTILHQKEMSEDPRVRARARGKGASR